MRREMPLYYSQCNCCGYKQYKDKQSELKNGMCRACYKEYEMKCWSQTWKGNEWEWVGREKRQLSRKIHIHMYLWSMVLGWICNIFIYHDPITISVGIVYTIWTIYIVRFLTCKLK